MLYELEKFAFEIDYRSASDEQACIIIVQEGRILGTNTVEKLPSFSKETLTQLGIRPNKHNIIGYYQQREVILINYKDGDDEDSETEATPLPNTQWYSLRSLLPNINETEFSILSRAVQVNLWQRNHKFCGRCGHTNVLRSPKELAMHCPQCQLDCYPRISPCVIVLIHNDDKILLARHGQTRRSNWYSTIAGFIECGESVEQCVHREIKEEVGIKVKNLRYQNSQTWPFPNQLMLGFFAEYESGEIEVDGEEIVDAKWWHIDALPSHPPALSISGWLIETYAEAFRQNLGR